MNPIEVTTKYATTVDEVTDAFAFVMEHMDKVGDDPSIEISPVWAIPVADMDLERPDEGWRRRFQVVVSGMVEDPHG